VHKLFVNDNVIVVQTRVITSSVQKSLTQDNIFLNKHQFPSSRNSHNAISDAYTVSHQPRLVVISGPVKTGQSQSTDGSSWYTLCPKDKT